MTMTWDGCRVRVACKQFGDRGLDLRLYVSTDCEEVNCTANECEYGSGDLCAVFECGG